ncbi:MULTISPECIES: signal recognition particle-docking protein FtsY [unclassified Lactococcus]|uniref:signal recognition particle-docking protein FtsY n=1 Tax=unclassified Lactococcus TaxID=2643510 RepID=UPI0011C83A7A|nr:MULTISPECIES: signal recognition particle-docking protein FtsY [unclassified Lactococcus]MQW22638.1 signal recognition particle-docking protein FtsY [Lactococcus sp. dk101]TXK45656.1 signal recognition particle-docking protein FtsY [Lactococcus sp. dk310]TXK51508.1 signal recognition particle-docking protein FtsY [Lactococcus sp. dk322]
MGLFNRLFGKKKETENEVVETVENVVIAEPVIAQEKQIEEAVSTDEMVAVETEQEQVVQTGVEADAAEESDTDAAVENVTVETVEPIESVEVVKEVAPAVVSEPAEEDEEITIDVDALAQIFAQSREETEKKYESSLNLTRQTFATGFNELFANFRAVDEEFFEDLEETLIMSDVGVELAMEITQELRQEAKLTKAKSPEDLRALIVEKIVDKFDEDKLPSALTMEDGLTVYLFVGVNGVGKTTTIGKLAARYKNEGKKVLLAAADTFRAGAIDQLVEWGKRSDVEVVTKPAGSDPASVVYDALQKAKAEAADILLIDTAGRLQNKDNLMKELEKIGKVIRREIPDAPHETILALDATTGQNAIQQAKEFSMVTPITGIALTKLDGSAKGGIVLSIVQSLRIPVKLIGLGEQLNDLQDFDEEFFVRGLFKELL